MSSQDRVSSEKPRFSCVGRAIALLFLGLGVVCLIADTIGLSIYPDCRGLERDRVADLFYQAQVHRSRGEWEKAIALYTKLIDNPQDYPDGRAPAALISRGCALAEAERVEEAIGDFTRYIQLAPDDSTGYYNRGILHRRRGDLAEALKDLDRAVECDPKGPLVRRCRGHTHYLLGNFADAVADYRECLPLKPLGPAPGAETVPFARLYHDAMTKEPKANYDLVMRQLGQRFRLEPKARTLVRFWLYLERLSHELEEPSDLVCRYSLDLLRYQRKARTYPRLWLYLAARRNGQDPGDALAAHLDVLGANEWPRPIYRMHLGQLSPEDCLDAVPDHETGWKCQARYHVAMVALLAGDTARATEQLRACLAIRADDLDEYACARADLRRLGSGTAAKRE